MATPTLNGSSGALDIGSALTPSLFRKEALMTQSLEMELKKLDDEINQLSDRLKAKKKARRKLAGALEQMKLL
jgi:hypothetical protein